jgi:hypothetical protein
MARGISCVPCSARASHGFEFQVAFDIRQNSTYAAAEGTERTDAPQQGAADGGVRQNDPGAENYERNPAGKQDGVANL